jgi:hypothetical protein
MAFTRRLEDEIRLLLAKAKTADDREAKSDPLTLHELNTMGR